jgi:hypothetical protein
VVCQLCCDLHRERFNAITFNKGLVRIPAILEDVRGKKGHVVSRKDVGLLKQYGPKTDEEVS